MAHLSFLSARTPSLWIQNTWNILDVEFYRIFSTQQEHLNRTHTILYNCLPNALSVRICETVFFYISLDTLRTDAIKTHEKTETHENKWPNKVTSLKIYQYDMMHGTIRK